MNRNNKDNLIELLREGPETWNSFVAEQRGPAPKTTEDPVEDWSAWLKWIQSFQPDLTDADLHELDLTGVDLQLARLVGADLSSSDLTGASFRSAICYGMDLTGTIANEVDFNAADLWGVEFRGTKCVGTDFRNGVLCSAIIWEADMTDAIFWFSVFGRTIIAATDFSKARHLSTIEHRGFSSISVDALFRSKFNLPQSFLLGCGCTKQLLRVGPSLLVPGAEKYASCFVSYSSEDSRFVEWFVLWLEERGIRYLLDKQELLPGDRVEESIRLGLRNWDKTLVVCSKNSIKSKWVQLEIDGTLELEKENAGQTRLIPVHLDDYVLNSKLKRAKVLKERVIADLSTWEDYAVGLSQRHESLGYEKFVEEREKVFRALLLESSGHDPVP